MRFEQLIDCELSRFTSTQAQREAHGGELLAPREAARAQQCDAEVQRGGELGRAQRESAGEFERERRAQQRAVGHTHFAHQGERVPIGAEQQVLAVVE